MFGLELIKSAVSVAAAAEIKELRRNCYPTTVYLERSSLQVDKKIYQLALDCFNNLSSDQKNLVEKKLWELEKKVNPVISTSWGREHFFDSEERLVSALRRLGFFKYKEEDLLPFVCYPIDPPGINHEHPQGLTPQYFCLSDRMHRNPLTGRISANFGIGVVSLRHGGEDLVKLSDIFFDGNNINFTFSPSYKQNQYASEFSNFAKDAYTIKAVQEGCHTESSYLVTQQLIDTLKARPGEKVLHVTHSGGSVHVKVALDFIKKNMPELLPRICLFVFCPAEFIFPEDFSEDPFLRPQIMNFYSPQDRIANWLATNRDRAENSRYVIKIPHPKGEGIDPHNFLTEIYREKAQPFINRFYQEGKLY